jgi:hypothetical protein
MDDKIKEILKWSNPLKAQQKAKEWLGNDAKLFISSKPSKKYDIYNPNTDKYISFGAMGYEDYTKHNDESRRDRYLRRASNIKGKWKDDIYSPNNLSINILW